MSTKLTNGSLKSIAGRAGIPAYERQNLAPGIVHFGVGNFHRAHQAVYLDALFGTGRDHDWAIIGAGVMPSDAAMRRALAGQDWLTTVVEQSADDSRAHVTGPMVDILPIGDPAAILEGLVDPEIRIVSLTVTEGGYFIDPAGRFNPDQAAIRADAAAPEAPKTVFGLIAEGLRRRREAGIEPFTVMSCDNIPHNGVVTRNAVTGTARLSDPALADWIAGHVAFPNGMVDRITPATGERERAMLAREFGIEDAWPVFCEDFKQWVLEDNFPAGRPELEAVGVQFVSDVSPFEIMKIRILNGGHATIAYPAGLLDIQFVHEAMANPLIRDFLQKVERDEILPIVPPVPDTDTGIYLAEIERRFSNPKIGDTVRRLCLDGSNRQPKFIIPSIADRLSAGASIDGLALVSALWCRYCHGETESGAAIAPNDPDWDRLVQAARAARDEPRAWLAQRHIYGDLSSSETLERAFSRALGALWKTGTKAALAAHVGSGS